MPEILLKNIISGTMKHRELHFRTTVFSGRRLCYARRCMFLDRPYYMNRRDNPNSSVNSREKVYCMNIEYDFIRDIFMQKGNEALWERFKGYYHFKRYHNYMFTLSRIGDAYKQEYTERIGKELKRAKELDELDLSLFTPAEQNKIQFLIKDPKAYYWKYVLYDGSKLTAEDVKNTVTFKIGAAVVYTSEKNYAYDQRKEIEGVSDVRKIKVRLKFR